VEIIKEVHIVCKNRWPVAMNAWDGTARRIIRPIVMQTLGKGAYFGELSIMKNSKRTASAFTTSRTTLIALDKLEFLHLVNHSKTSDLDELARGNKTYPTEEQLLDGLGHISGGPGSFAFAGEVKIEPNKVIRVPPVDPRAAHSKAMKETEALMRKSPAKVVSKNSAPSSPQRENYKKDYDKLYEEDVKKKALQEKFALQVRRANFAKHEEDEEQEAIKEVEEQVAHQIRKVDKNPLKAIESVHKHKGLRITIPNKNAQTITQSTSKARNATTTSFLDVEEAGDRAIMFRTRSMEKAIGGAWSKIRFGDSNQIQPLVGVVTEERRVAPGVPNRRLRAESEQEQAEWEEQYLNQLMAEEDSPPSSPLRFAQSDRRPKSSIAVLKERLKKPKFSYFDVMGVDA